MNVSLAAAFLAGVFSITSPCILPIVPLYLAYLAGSNGESSVPSSRQRLIVNAFGFVLGFTLIFVLLGTAFGAVGSLLSTRRTLVIQLGGLLLIVLGLHQIGLFRIPFLERTRRVSGVSAPAGSFSASLLVGMTFAAGWSPCAGPVLGAILTLALADASASRATLLLAVYSAGLAIPFLAMAVAGASSAMLRWLAARTELLSGAAGAVMLAIGVVMVLGWYQQFFARLVGSAPWSPFEPSV